MAPTFRIHVVPLKQQARPPTEHSFLHNATVSNLLLPQLVKNSFRTCIQPEDKFLVLVNYNHEPLKIHRKRNHLKHGGRCNNHNSALWPDSALMLFFIIILRVNSYYTHFLRQH
jgi:hypothetical protein